MTISLSKDPSWLLLTSDHKPTKQLQAILKLCGINPDLSLKEIIHITQKVWLRPTGLERWQLNETSTDDNRAQLLQLFNASGIVKAINPTEMNYDSILYMGGDLPGMRKRLAYMLEIWKRGIRWNKISFLTAQRFLDPSHESLQKIYDISLNDFTITTSMKKPEINPHTECDLLKILYEQAQLPIDLQKVPLEYINTPNKLENDLLVRATTPDAVAEWLKTSPNSGTYLIISCQPLVGYQHAVTRTLLPKDFIIESCGPQAASDVSCNEYFDTLARWLYQEGILRKII